MKRETLTVCGRDCIVCCGAQPKTILLQPTGAHEQNALDAQLALLEQRCGDGFLFAAFPVTDWNRELSPWDAPPVFGTEAFGHGATETLTFIERELLPMLLQQYDLPEDLPVILGGYSLAGLFSLWSAFQTDRFAAVAAASPSVWFPGWLDFARQGTILTKHVYLSLGDREEKNEKPCHGAGGCLHPCAGTVSPREGRGLCAGMEPGQPLPGCGKTHCRGIRVVRGTNAERPERIRRHMQGVSVLREAPSASALQIGLWSVGKARPGKRTGHA